MIKWIESSPWNPPIVIVVSLLVGTLFVRHPNDEIVHYDIRVGMEWHHSTSGYRTLSGWIKAGDVLYPERHVNEIRIIRNCPCKEK